MTLLSHRWRVPALSGFLIVSSWLAGALAWPAAGWLMLAAALVAGAPVAWSAARALRLRVIGIDLLVAVDFMAWVRESVPEDCTHLCTWYDRARTELEL